MNSSSKSTAIGSAFSIHTDPAHKPLARARSWLLESGIRIADPADENYGAVYAYYDSRGRRHELVYAEATGYILSLFRYLYSLGKDDQLLEMARVSGDWLLKFARQHEDPIVQGVVQGKTVAEAYSFDNGVCCKGLLDLYELTGETKYLSRAERFADWLLSRAWNADGSVRPLFNIRSGKFIENAAVWYKASGSFHAKIAMPLLQLHRIKKRQDLLEGALMLCLWAIRQQRSDGRFPANEKLDATNLHAHCYTVEALLYAHALVGEPALLEAAQKGIRWIVRRQGSNGQHWLWHRGNVTSTATGYAQAQVVRILALFDKLIGTKDRAPATRAAADFLVGMQVSNEHQRSTGGILEPAVKKYGLISRTRPQLTSWAAMFAIHALSLLSQPNRDFDEEIRYLF